MIISGSEFNPNSDVVFAKPRINKSGGKAVAVLQSSTNRWLHLSSPLMLTWGVNEFVDDASGRRSYDLALQFPKQGYETEATTKFLAAMQAFEAKIKDSAVSNAKAWFGKQRMSAEVVDALFHPMLRHPRNKDTGEPDLERSPTLKIKLDFYDEAFNCEIYDIEKGAGGAHKRLFPDDAGSMEGPGPMDLVAKGSNVACILKCGGLWFANGKFGCTWKLVQAIVKPRESMRGKCMIQLSAADQAVLESQTTAEDTDTSEAPAALVEESDEEEEEDEEEDAGETETVEETPPTPQVFSAPKAKVKAGGTKVKVKAGGPKVKKTTRKAAGAQ